MEDEREESERGEEKEEEAKVEEEEEEELLLERDGVSPYSVVLVVVCGCAPSPNPVATASVAPGSTMAVERSTTTAATDAVVSRRLSLVVSSNNPL